MGCSKENKRIINRFFKDVGLYNTWRNYLLFFHDKYTGVDGLSLYSPPNENYAADSVIADTHISKYIKEDMGINFEPNMVHHFRMYIIEKYPEYVLKLGNPHRLMNAAENHKWENGKYLIKGIHY